MRGGEQVRLCAGSCGKTGWSMRGRLRGRFFLEKRFDDRGTKE